MRIARDGNEEDTCRDTFRLSICKTRKEPAYNIHFNGDFCCNGQRIRMDRYAEMIKKRSAECAEGVEER